jgi:hypothetical protein
LSTGLSSGASTVAVAAAIGGVVAIVVVMAMVFLTYKRWEMQQEAQEQEEYQPFQLVNPPALALAMEEPPNFDTRTLVAEVAMVAENSVDHHPVRNNTRASHRMNHHTVCEQKQ